MCNFVSGHVVTEKGKNWGKVLVFTAIHNEIDRQQKSFFKYGENLIAWETIKPGNVSEGVNFTHDCGKNIPKKEKSALKEIVNDWIIKKGIDYFIKKIFKNNTDLNLRGTGITSLPDNLSVGGYLDLKGTGITSLPDNLSVGGSLYKNNQ